MIQLIYFIILLLMISMLLLFLNYMFSKKSFKDREKISPFECGFDPMSPTHMPFSNQFFQISLIFLIFDIEITILLPLIYAFKLFNLSTILISFMFLLLLIFGLYLEYSEQSIDWKT